MLHLVVTEQEDGWRSCAASLKANFFQILSPLCHAVILCNFYAEQLIISQEGCQAGQALSATPANTNLQWRRHQIHIKLQEELLQSCTMLSASNRLQKVHVKEHLHSIFASK